MTEGNGIPKRVLIVDDNAFNRDGLALYLASQGFVTQEAGDEATALQLARATRPGSAVVDIVIPATADGKASVSQSIGLRVVRELKELDPMMGIVIFSAYEDRGGEVWDLIREGVRGVAYMLKGIRPERVLQALEDTMAGHVILDGDAATSKPQLAEEIRDHLTPSERPWVERAVRLMPTLSPREMDVARRLAASYNTQGLVDTLGIAQKTVENHVGRVYEKLGLADVDTQAPSLRKSMLLAKACMIYELTGGDDISRRLDP